MRRLALLVLLLPLTLAACQSTRTPVRAGVDVDRDKGLYRVWLDPSRPIWFDARQLLQREPGWAPYAAGVAVRDRRGRNLNCSGLAGPALLSYVATPRRADPIRPYRVERGGWTSGWFPVEDLFVGIASCPELGDPADWEDFQIAVILDTDAGPAEGRSGWLDLR